MPAARRRAPLLGLTALSALALAAALPQTARAQVAGTSTGVFTGYTGGADNPTPYVPSGGSGSTAYGVNTSTLVFGNTGGSGITNEFAYSGGSFSTNFGTPFTVGTFTFQNGSINSGTGIDAALLKTTLTFTQPGVLGSQSFTYNIPLTLTSNGGTDPQADADYITLPTSQPSEVFTFGGVTYTLQLSGFNTAGLNPADGFLTGPGGVGTTGNTELHVYEQHSASAGITGTLTRSLASTVPEPSTVAAFALTGLAAAALMLRARKRHAV